jgi:hypothetical protein
MDLSIEVIVTGTSVKLILSWNLATINIVAKADVVSPLRLARKDVLVVLSVR